MSPPIILFLRHGEADHNVAQRTDGDSAYEDPRWRDARLSHRGHEQTLAAGEEIAARFGSQFQAVWSSPLTRCVQTSENAMKSIRAPHHILHDSLLERLGGGHICNERSAKVDIVLQHPGWQIQYLPHDGPRWGSIREPEDSVRMRMTSLLLYLEDKYRDAVRPILVVSHHDAIQALFGVSLRNGEFHIHR